MEYLNCESQGTSELYQFHTRNIFMLITQGGPGYSVLKLGNKITKVCKIT